MYEELLKTPLVDQSSASFEIAGFLSKVFGRNTSQLYGIWGDLVFLDSKFQFSGYFTSDADTPDVRMFLLSAAGLGRRTVSYPHGADFVPQQRHRNLAGVSLHYGELSASCAKASGVVATAFIGKPTRVRSGFGHVRQDGNSAEGGERAIVVFLSEAPFWMAPYSRVGARMVMQLLESLYSLGCERRVILKGHPMGSHSIWKSVIGQLRVGNVEYVSDPWGPREIVDNAAFAVFLSNPSTTLMNMLCEKESLGVPVVVVPFPSEDFSDLSMYGLVQPDILQAAKTIVRFLADIDADSRDQQVARLDSLNKAYFGNVEDPIKRVSFLLSML